MDVDDEAPDGEAPDDDEDVPIPEELPDDDAPPLLDDELLDEDELLDAELLETFMGTGAAVAVTLAGSEEPPHPVSIIVIASAATDSAMIAILTHVGAFSRSFTRLSYQLTSRRLPTERWR
jgi:hypothetical protein